MQRTVACTRGRTAGHGLLLPPPVIWPIARCPVVGAGAKRQSRPADRNPVLLATQVQPTIRNLYGCRQPDGGLRWRRSGEAMYRFTRIGRAEVRRWSMRGSRRVGMQRTMACTRGRIAGNGLLLTAVAVVSIVICSAAGVFAWRTISVDRTLPSLNTANPAVGYAFYAALGEVLAGDEATSLQRVVTDDFVDHESNAETAKGIDELTAELSAFGATFPNVRVAVESIASSGDSLIAQLSPSTLAGGSVAGLTMAPIQVAGSVEVLHIRHGRVSERWATRLPECARRPSRQRRRRRTPAAPRTPGCIEPRCPRAGSLGGCRARSRWSWWKREHCR